MTRSLLRPIRTRRVAPGIIHLANKTAANRREVTLNTRNTVATIGALWVSFDPSASPASSAKFSRPSPDGVSTSTPEQSSRTAASAPCADSKSFSK
jgi:hypothetical protein